MKQPFSVGALLFCAATASAGSLAQGSAAPAPGNNSLASRSLAANCANCHGTNGRSAGVIPSLAGQSRDNIARAMREFRDGKRPATIMHQLVKGYTEEQIDMLAAWFAAQK